MTPTGVAGDPLPPIRPAPSVGALRLLQAFRSDVLGAFSASAYSDLRVSFRRFGRRFIFLSDPEDINHVLNTHIDRYQANILGWRTELTQNEPLYLDTDAAFGMASFMPLTMMARVVLAPGLPANIKRDLALAVWTRAVLLDDADTAKSMADAVAPFFPQFADNWKVYRNAANAAARKVEAALLLLKLPAARPYPDTGLGFIYKRDQIGLYGPRWWAKDETPFGNADDKGNPILCPDCALPMPLVAPPFLTEKDKASAEADNARLGKLPGAPAYLGAIVIPYFAVIFANGGREPTSNRGFRAYEPRLPARRSAPDRGFAPDGPGRPDGVSPGPPSPGPFTDSKQDPKGGQQTA